MTVPARDLSRAAPPLTALALLLVGASCLAAKAAPVQNLALNCPYTLNCETLPGWDGLVDGIKDSDDPPGCFATDNSAKFPKSAVLDLGCLCDVSKIVVYNSANGNTREVIVSLSKDAKTYDTLRDYVFPNGRFQPLIHSFTARKGRFVKLTFKDSWHGGLGGDNIIYLREVEVFGRRLEKPDSGTVWSFLATAPTVIRSPSWYVVRRYLGEINRPTRLAVLTDSTPEAILGPDAWLTRSLSETGRLLGPNGVKLASFSTVTDGPAALTALEASLDHDAPDVLLVAYSVVSDEPLAANADHAIDACARAGSAVIMMLPPPSQEDQAAPAKFRQRHRRLLAVASGAGALVIDEGAVLARSTKPAALITAHGLTAEGQNLLGDALTAALSK